MPKRTNSHRELSTAIHEAGHAVVAFFLRVRIKYVTIMPDKKRGTLGHVRQHPVRFARQGVFDDSLRGVDRAERYILVLFAGQIAQRKHAPRSRWRDGGSTDREKAMELFWRICSNDERARKLYLRLLWRKAECYVDAHWSAIQAVARELIARTTLTAEQSADVILRSAAKRTRSLLVNGTL